MAKMSTVEMRIVARSRKHRGEALTNLHEYIDEAMLHESFAALNKESASGVDGETWKQYNEKRSERIPQLLRAFKSGSYKAPHIRRVYIPKDDGKQQRPLGLPTIEDKLLQTAVTRVLTPIYEQMFYTTSYGFRPGKSQHQAVEELFREVSFEGMQYIIDADMKNYFGSIDHGCLRELLDLRIKDGVIRRMIDKWLKAGVLENGQVEYPTEGTPQGGSISPLLSNIYLHYVLDEWFIKQIEPLLDGKCFLLRYADDFLIGFTSKKDAMRVMKALPKRLSKYGLTLHPEKTKMIKLKDGEKDEPRTFDFLGFTHYMGKSLKGNLVLKRKTSSKKFRITVKKMEQWIKDKRHEYKAADLIGKLNLKLNGHYGYYGITFNSKKLSDYYEQTKRKLFKWLNRCGNRRAWTWETYNKLIKEWVPLIKPRICHSYVLTKP